MKAIRTIEDYENAILGRANSLFAEDVEVHEKDISQAFKGSRIAIIGAAGSIGRPTFYSLLKYQPRSVVLFDLSENNLTEFIRDLRSESRPYLPNDLESLPIGMGSTEFTRYIKEQKNFDYILNFSALKHVRSEKNVYSIIRMIDTNMLYLKDLITNLPRPVKKLFSVSSDKAVNPHNLMGATKLVMEKILVANEHKQPFSTARFANVSFSEGSLLQGFLYRIEKQQVIAAPMDVKRYFISHREAGELCLLSTALGNNSEVFFPKLSTMKPLSFNEIAVQVLALNGFTPEPITSEEEARSRASQLIASKKWPCVFSESNTTGEKDLEEFYKPTDHVEETRFKQVATTKLKMNANENEQLQSLYLFLDRFKTDPKLTKEDCIREFQKLEPGFVHVEKGATLDNKM